MQDDLAPPSPLPPAARPPWPAHPAPHDHSHDPAPHGATSRDVARAKPSESEPAIGTLGIALISGALAAAIGLAVALPWLRSKPAPTRAARRSRAKATAPKKPRTASTPGPKPGSKRTPKSN